MDSIGVEQSHVLDAFSGEGAMYRAVWHRAASYVGIDKQLYMDDRPAYVGDNLRILRAIDLARITVFDLDAHGSPWHQLYIIAARRPLEPGERIGLVLTEGLGLKMNMGGLGKALGKLARVRLHMPGMGAARSELIERALREVCRKMHARIVHRWEANGRKGSRVAYIGLVLEEISAPTAAAGN